MSLRLDTGIPTFVFDDTQHRIHVAQFARHVLQIDEVDVERILNGEENVVGLTNHKQFYSNQQDGKFCRIELHKI